MHGACILGGAEVLTLKITILTDAAQEGSKNHDPVVGQVAAALRQADHKVSIFAVHGDLKRLLAGLGRRGARRGPTRCVGPAGEQGRGFGAPLLGADAEIGTQLLVLEHRGGFRFLGEE